MTKRERAWHNRNKRDRFWGRAFAISSEYMLTKLKIRQLITRSHPIPQELIDIKEDLMQELKSFIEPQTIENEG